MDSVMRQFMVERRFWLFGRRCRRKEWKFVEQGFIDQFGNFLNRHAAFTIANMQGQLRDNKRSSAWDSILFSEDLY